MHDKVTTWFLEHISFAINAHFFHQNPISIRAYRMKNQNMTGYFCRSVYVVIILCTLSRFYYCDPSDLCQSREKGKYCKFGNFHEGFNIAKRFVNRKPSRNGEITLSATDEGIKCLSRDFLPS